MRHTSCSAFTSCELPLSTGKKYVAVHLLTGQLLYFVADVKGNGRELFEQVCDVLKVTDTKWFGLALLVDDEYHFIDQNIKLSKYAPKAWKSLHGSGIDSSGKPFLSFYFRVQFYINCHLLINDRVARHHYYFQLRENVTAYSLALSEERAFQLAAFALQADLGNYHSDKHKGRYFEPLKYFPAWIVGKIGEEYIIQHAPAMHQDITGISRGEAHTLYIKESSNEAAPHNLHLYKLHRKKSKNMSTVWLGICFNGIEVYEENDSVTKKHLSTFLWCDIVKLFFEKKKFEIQTNGCPEPRKFTYYTRNEELAKNLLWLCRMTHQFNMFVQPQVQELQRRESEEDKPYREAYIYSNSLDLAWEKGQRKLYLQRNTLPCGISLLKKAGSKTSEQRVSVISNASSTTTSGIVSDKVQSFDESEDDLDMEIMINSPPANHSAEDLVRSSDIERHDYGNSLSSIPPNVGCSSFTGQSSTGEREPSFQTFCKCAFLPKNGSSYSSYPSTSSSTGLSDQEYHPGGACVKHSASVNVINVNNPANCTNSEQQTDKSNSFHLKLLNKDSPPKNETNVGQLLANPSQDKLPGVKPLENGNSLDSQSNKVTLHIEGNCKAPLNSGNSVETMQNGHTSLPSNSHSDTNSLNVFQNSSVSNQSVSFPHYHGRTATRIGVSSLTRVQRLPLTLFGRQPGIGVAGSEPNLSNVVSSPNSLPCYYEGGLLSFPFGSINDKDALCSKLGHFQQNGLENCNGNGLKYENSAMHSNIKETLSISRHLNGVAQNQSSKNIHPLNKNSSDEKVMGVNKNSILFQSYDLQEQPTEDPLGVTGTLGCSSRMRLGSLPVLPTTSNPINGNVGTANSLDLQQLRQKSQDMDLPLISALCNDRSLLMLPKTVPTCSRQRHLGTNKDMRRFSYTYMNSGSISDGLSSLGEVKNVANITQSSALSRPISWHVESAEYPWKPSNDTRSENKSCCSPLENGNLKDSVGKHCTGEVTSSSSLSSTILTSFSKLSDRRTHNGSKDGYSGHITACGANPKQMIPMKLSSAVMR